MRLRYVCCYALLLTLTPRAFGFTLQQDYVDGYFHLSQAGKLEKNGNVAAALQDYQICFDKLNHLHADAPDWEPKLVRDTLAVCENHMRALKPVAGAKPAPSPPLLQGAPFDASDATPQEKYLDIYLGLNEAEGKEHKGDSSSALTIYQECIDQLRQLRADDPGWETVLIDSRLEDCRAKLATIRTSLHALPTPSVSSTNGVTSPITLSVPNSPLSVPVRSIRYYPWKKNISTTVFWIAPKSFSPSAWDPHWVHDNGGDDDPDQMTRRSGYSYMTHASELNRFYVALPFNDLAHPYKAARWMPSTWTKRTRGGKPVSVCEGRWIELKNANGRICFAQWEDVGPLTDDDPEYVFGSQKPHGKNGLAVSPSVAKYLGFNTSALLSWRFVDDGGVQPGMWLRYDEQALLFTAFHQLDNTK